MDLTTATKAIFENRNNYEGFNHEDKEYIFFIFNRLCARRFPKVAQALNRKNTDKSLALDIWYVYFRNSKSIPFWWWPKKKKTEKDTISEKLKLRYPHLRDNDIKFLNLYFKDMINDEIEEMEIMEQEFNKPTKVKKK